MSLISSGTMTTGIALTNGLETVLLCDEMVTAGQRQSVSAIKLGEISTDSYHGALIGAGAANIVLGGITAAHIKEIGEGSLDEFIGQVGKWVGKKLDAYDRHWLSEQLNNATKKSELISSEQERLQYMNAETARIWQQFDQYKEGQRQNPVLQLIVAAHDKKLAKARVFLISGTLGEEIYLPHVEIGSGADAAQLYFLEMLQGINTGNLKADQLLVHVSSAYMKSTLNVGVGGTPRMMLITEKEARNLSGLVAPLLTNVCGYHLAGALTAEEVKDVAEATLASNSAKLSGNIREISGKLRTSEEDLMRATVPLSVIHKRLKPYERY